MELRSQIRSFFLIGFCLIGASACSSKKGPPARVDQTPSEWDHEKIREVRQAESAQSAQNSSTDNDEDTSSDNCTIMTAAAAKRGRVSGCRPLDPREGHGPNSVCCPKK